MKGIIFKQSHIPYNTGRIFIDNLIKYTEDAFVINYDNVNYSNNDWIGICNDLKDHNDYDFMFTGIDFGLYDNMKPLYQIGVPVIMSAGNSWERLKNTQWKNCVDKHKPSIIMLDDWCSRFIYNDHLQRDDLKYIWRQFDAPLDIMKDYGENKIWDISLSGKPSYNDRRYYERLLPILSKKHNISYKRLLRTYSYEEYGRNLNKSKMSMSSVQNDPYYNNIYIGANVPKNIEITACKSCLFTREWGDADLMGFFDDENCILFDDNNEIEEKLVYYLDNPEILNKITEKGYKLTHSKHTPQKHMSKFLNDLKRLLKRV